MNAREILENLSTSKYRTRKCNHRTDYTTHSLNFSDNNKIATCTNCGESFELVQYGFSDNKINDIINEIKNIIQSIIVYDLELDENQVEAFHILIEMIDKVPDAYKNAVTVFNKIVTSSTNINIDIDNPDFFIDTNDEKINSKERENFINKILGVENIKEE